MASLGLKPCVCNIKAWIKDSRNIWCCISSTVAHLLLVLKEITENSMGTEILPTALQVMGVMETRCHLGLLTDEDKFSWLTCHCWSLQKKEFCAICSHYLDKYFDWEDIKRYKTKFRSLVVISVTSNRQGLGFESWGCLFSRCLVCFSRELQIPPTVQRHKS